VGTQRGLENGAVVEVEGRFGALLLVGLARWCLRVPRRAVIGGKRERESIGRWLGVFLIILFYFILGVLSRAKDERNCEDLRSQITIHRCRKIGN
jgi:hypothetical protein